MFAKFHAAERRTSAAVSGSSKTAGFTLLEIMIVLSVILIMGAIAVPMYLNMVYSVRLRSAASNLSGFIQRARITAAKNNAIYAIGYRPVAGAEEAYIDLNLSGTYDAGEPLLTFSPTITPATGAPNGTAGAPSAFVLVGDSAGTTYDNATTLAYSPRGLPCAYVAGNCATPAAGYFVYYLRDQRPSSVGWAAVVVTRSGRSKIMTWNGTAWQ